MRIVKYKTMLNDDRILTLVKEEAKNINIIDTNSPIGIADFCVRYLSLNRLPEEHVILFCLTRNGKLIGYFELSQGSQGESIVDPKSVFSKALLCNAAAIIIAHNHPSGDASPSRTDKDSFEKLRKGGMTLGIFVHDSIIIGENAVFSLCRGEAIA